MEAILPALVHIQTHLEDSLSLENLAATCGLSPHHFHRVFKDALSETARCYVERLRVGRATFLLRYTTDSVIDIALAVGYQSHEVFTRAFRRHRNESPRSYRESATPTGQRSRHPSLAASKAAMSKLEGLSSLRVHHMEGLHLGYIRNLGPYEDVDVALFAQVRGWLRSHKIAGDHILCGLGHDAPEITAPEQLRFDACATVDAPFQGDGNVGYQCIAPRLVATMTFVGPLSKLPEVYARLGEELALLHNYDLCGLPVLEMYGATQIGSTTELFHTDIQLPIERVSSETS